MVYLRYNFERYVIWLGILLIANAVPVSAVCAKPAVSNIRMWEHPDKTRFVVDLTEKVDFEIETLTNPYRLVINLNTVNWQVPALGVPKQTGVIRSWRKGQFDYKTFNYRIVLDLNGPVTKRVMLLAPAQGNMYRLVVDLISTDRRSIDSSSSKKPIRNRNDTPRPSTTIRFSAPKIKPIHINVPQIVVVIDPGHGGIDPGATTSSGLLEKDIVLLAAKVMKLEFKRTGRYQVYLTREKDNIVRLRKRFQIAQDKRAGVFLSLHADSIKSKKVGGMSLYTLSNKASGREAARLAKKENEFELRAGFAYDDVSKSDALIRRLLLEKAKDGFRMAQMDEIKESQHLAKELRNEMRKVGKMLPNSLRSAGFAVLKSPDHPSVLIELGFLSNPKDVRNLQSKRHLQRISSAIVKAVDRFCSRTSNPCIPTFQSRRD